MADTSRRVAGVAHISVDGVTHNLVGDLTYSPSIVKRETLAGMDRVHGYSEMPTAGYISGTLRDSGALTVADFNAMTNVTVVAELANGKIVIARNAWCVEVQEVKAAEGTFDVRFDSELVEEA